MTDDMSTGNTRDGDQLQLEIFRRKCLQMLDPDEINYPMEWFMKLPATQKWIYDHLFNEENVAIMPYAPYAYRILKKLMSILEAAMKDPEEDVSLLPMAYLVARFHKHFLNCLVSRTNFFLCFPQEISDDLANCFAEMLARKSKNEIDSIQEKRPVTYTAPVLDVDPPTVTILEAPSLLASNGDTGNRTWDAALFLATYLFTDGRRFVQDKSILELGGGLGFVSIFCGKHLDARHVLLTDASEAILNTAKHNAEINGVGSTVQTSVLEWGTRDFDLFSQNEGEAVSYDLILGADMVCIMLQSQALYSSTVHFRLLHGRCLEHHTCVHRHNLQRILYEILFYCYACPFQELWL